MKRTAAFILAILFAVCVASTAAAYTTMYVYTSNGKPLNLRDSPSILGNVMAQIPDGARVRVNDIIDEAWDSVTYSGYTGYAMSRYLVYATPTNTPCPVPTATPSPTVFSSFPNDIFLGFQDVYYTAFVRPSNPAGYVNLRWAPSLLSDVHGRYYANSVLTVMSQNSLWCQVLDESGHVMGFIMRQFLYPYYGDEYPYYTDVTPSGDS
jgi:uncharacterized protein YgiM (DUF1202 family)